MFGKEVKAPNGWYDRKDGSIHIDLNAGDGGRGTVLFTLSHELTHFIEEWSPKKYKVLADFLIKEYEKGQSMDALVRKKQKDLSAARGKAVGYEEAFSEVVANSMEAMLADGNVMDKIVRLKAQDRDIVARMKAFFDNLITKIRNAYKDIDPDSTEGYEVIKMTADTIEQLQQLFAEAIVESSDNFRTAEKNTTNKSSGVMFMSRSIEEVTDDTVRNDLTNVFDGKDVAAKSYIPLSKTTPFAVRYITGYKNDLPIIVEKKKAYFDMRENGKFKEDSNHHYHGMGVDGFLDAMGILDDPEYAIQEEMKNGTVHYAFISTNENGEELCVVFQMNVTKPAGQMNGYPGGYYNIDITEFVATDEWLEDHGVEPGTSYKDYLLSFSENSIVYDRSIHFEQLEKARIIDSESAGLAASYNNNRAFKNKLTQTDSTVKNKYLEAVDIELDERTESVAPEILFSERTWTESDYVQERDYQGGHSSFPVAQGIVDEFVSEYKQKNGDRQYSDRTDESVSSRNLLANALESTIQTDWERRKLQEYNSHMNIDVKQNADGEWFYSFAIEKGSAPQTLLAAVTDKSATLPTTRVPKELETVKNNSIQNIDIEIDDSTKSGDPEILKSDRTDEFVSSRTLDHQPQQYL